MRGLPDQTKALNLAPRGLAGWVYDMLYHYGAKANFPGCAGAQAAFA